MLELRHRNADAWPAELRPKGDGGLGPEGSEAWWDRNSGQLGNLHPQIAEQWLDCTTAARGTVGWIVAS